MTIDELKKWSVGITNREFDDLSVSLEYDDDPSQVYPVILYVPDMNKHDHEHIPLDREHAEKLRDWLTAYLDLDPQR